MSTQSEILQRQSTAVGGLEANSQRLSKFVNGASHEVVETVDGVHYPTLRGLINEMRQQGGYRTYEITFFVHDLERYGQQAEPLFYMHVGENLVLPHNLNDSHFALRTPTGATTRYEIIVGELARYVVEFAPDEQVGVVIEHPDHDIEVPKNTSVEVNCLTSAYTSMGFSLRMKSLIAELPDPA